MNQRASRFASDPPIPVPRTRRLWSDRVAIWGGLATVILTDVFTDEEFERFLDDLFAAVAPGDRFVLGFGDNVPTDALFDRIRRIARYWADHGCYPLAGESPAYTRID